MSENILFHPPRRFGLCYLFALLLGMAAPRASALEVASSVFGNLFEEGVDVTFSVTAGSPQVEYTVREVEGPYLHSATVDSGTSFTVPVPGRGLYKLRVVSQTAVPDAFETYFAVVYPQSEGAREGVWMFFTDLPSLEHAQNLRRMGVTGARLNFQFQQTYYNVTPPSDPADVDSGSIDFAVNRALVDRLLEAGFDADNIMGTLEGIPVSMALDGNVHKGALTREHWRWLVRNTVTAFPEIQYWEVWNEPDFARFYSGTKENFAHMVIDTYDVMREIDGPGTTKKILCSGFTSKPGGPTYFRDLMNLGIQDSFDILSIHYTSGNRNDILGFKGVLDDFGFTPSTYPPIWNTEEDDPAPVGNLIEGIPVNVKFVYLPADGSTGTAATEGVDFHPTRHAAALRTYSHLLNGATFEACVPGSLPDNDDVVNRPAARVARFGKPDGQKIHVAWHYLMTPNLDGAWLTAAVDPGLSSVTLTDDFGRESTLSVEDGEVRIFLETKPFTDGVADAPRYKTYITGTDTLTPTGFTYANPDFYVLEAESGSRVGNYVITGAIGTSGNKIITLSPTKDPGPHGVDLTFSVNQAGWYDLIYFGTNLEWLPPRSDVGLVSPFSWQLDSEDPVEIRNSLPVHPEQGPNPPDLYSANRLGQMNLSTGTHTLRFRLLEPRENDGNYFLRLDALVLQPAVELIDLDPPEYSIVVDDSFPNAVSSGSWTGSGGTFQSYIPEGLDPGPYWYFSSDGVGGKTFTYTPDIPETGYYKVAMWWPQRVMASAQTRVNIHHADGIASLNVNQAEKTGMWNTVGEYRFLAGTGGKLVVRSDGVPHGFYVIADAVRFQGGPVSLGSVAPLSVSGIEDNAASFTWNEEPNAGNYWFELATDSGFTLPVFTDTEINPLLNLTGLDSGTEHHARVAAKKGAALGPFATAAFTTTGGGTGIDVDLILDNEDPEVSYFGTWTGTGSTSDQIWGTASPRHRLYNQSARSGFHATFRPNLPEAGAYTVYEWHQQRADYASSVPLTIQSAEGTANLTINQTTSGSQWNLLDTYTFDAGNGGFVRIHTDGTEGIVIADALRFVKAGAGSIPPPPPDELIIDNTHTHLTSTVGTWRGSGANLNAYLPPDATGTPWLYNNDGIAGDCFNFAPDFSEAGTYEVALWWPTRAGAAPSVDVVVTHADGNDTLTVDQTQSGGQWNSLGVFSFEAGGGSISIRTDGVSAGLFVLADAVRFTRQADPIVVDNQDTNQVTPAGTWGGSGNTNGAYIPTGTDGPYWRYNTSGSATDAFTFSIPVGEAGEYRVSVWWPHRAGAAANAPVTVTHAEGTDTVTVNQSQNGGQWNEIGIWSFSPASAASVSIRTQGVTAGVFVLADAVRLDPVGD
ncbi:MAG: hypothetical protein WD490_06150 [Opitutales bacterium]